MIVFMFVMGVMVAVAAVRAALGLKGSAHVCKIRSEATEHILTDVVGPNAKNLISNFSRQMPISQMPGKTHKLVGIFMPDLDSKFRSGLNLQPSPIVKLQAISIGHCNRLREIQKDIFALIRSQANATAMACVELESK